MRYFKQYKGFDEIEEISYDDALVTLLGSYKDNEVTRSFLTLPNFIPCSFSFVYITDDDGVVSDDLPMGQTPDWVDLSVLG